MSKPQTEFEQASQSDRPSVTSELVVFLANNKKWWMLPILIMAAILGFFMLFAGSGAAPFIYTLF